MGRPQRQTIARAGPEAGSAAVVRWQGPVDLPGSLEVFRRSGDDLLDRWDGRVWLRALPLDGRMVAMAARPAGTVAQPALLVEAEAGARPKLVPAARALAGAFVSAPEALRGLAAADPVVAGIASRFPGVGPVLQPDLLTAVVRSISAQQITLRFAAVLRGRLARRFGRRHEVPIPAPPGQEPGPDGPAPPPGEGPGPDGPAPPGPAVGEVWSLDAGRLAGATVAELRALQLSNSKAVAMIGFAGAVARGRVDLVELAGLPDEEVIARLVVFPGIGRWTAEWLLARTLGRPRVVAGDLGVRKAVGAAYLGGRMPSEAEVRAATAHWGPAAGVAQQLLLHWLSVEAPRVAGSPTGSTSATRPARSSRRG
jgi:DNA-3-methyladenine glycosylase II